MTKNKGVVFWIPEAPNFPGLYANDTDFSGTGKIQGLRKQPSTRNIYDALQFETEAWCDTNPHLVFVPRDHEFI